MQDLCKYFRWNGPPGRFFHGYTHFDSPIGIMVNTRCVGLGLLNAVAEECFHIHQDADRGKGWRRDNEQAAEEEAKNYVRSIEAGIKNLLGDGATNNADRADLPIIRRLYLGPRRLPERD